MILDESQTAVAHRVIFKNEMVLMTLDTNLLVPMTEANQNFSRVTRLVDESGMAVILKNNRPRYMVVRFSEYDAIKAAREKLVGAAVDHVIGENLEALRELAR
jgi:antitoxin Phd